MISHVTNSDSGEALSDGAPQSIARSADACAAHVLVVGPLHPPPLTGAAWTALVTMALHALLQYVFVMGTTRLRAVADLARVASAALVGVIAVTLVSPQGLLPRATLGLALYALGLLALGAVTPRDSAVLRRVLRRAAPRWWLVMR